VEPRGVGVVCREVRETGRGTSRTGPAGILIILQACRLPQNRRFSLKRDCGRCPMRVQERRAGSQTMRSTRIRASPAE
jgi:hypothetical protein